MSLLAATLEFLCSQVQSKCLKEEKSLDFHVVQWFSLACGQCSSHFRSSLVAVCTLCFDLSDEASEPWGVCSRKNYLKTCQDATTCDSVPRLFPCLLFPPFCVFMKLLQQV